jgi:phosphoglycerate-specific signal transduction histidine kinase
MEKMLELILERMDKGFAEVKAEIQEVKEVVQRIEQAQQEEVVAMLKLNQRKLNEEVDYAHTRIKEVDKKVNDLASRLNN